MENDLIIATWLLNHCNRFFAELDVDDCPIALNGLVNHWLAQREIKSIAHSQVVTDFRDDYMKALREALD